MDNGILSALRSIPVSETSYSEWLGVGMALQQEGFSPDVWDEWSRGDPRYHPGECERKWQSFRGSANPVTGASIIKLAQRWGGGDPAGGALDWDADILCDDDPAAGNKPALPRSPTEQLRRYLELLFEPDDLVGYVSAAFEGPDGKWRPAGRGDCDRTAGELIASLQRYPDDLGATIGDTKPAAGAWIRFNPLDGRGTGNANVTRFRYALVESDSMPLDRQEELYRRLQLPIRVMVHSGGRSLHAIVHVDAPDAGEYRRRVDFLYSYLEKNGVQVDRQNSNPSRLSRMPGVMRGDRLQYIAAENIGKSCWDEWYALAAGDADDSLPPVVTLDAYRENEPELPPELIGGILRCGHKMLISGSSKAGKSFLLMELCIALAEGRQWLGFPCRQGRVLYINLEIDPASCIKRFLDIYAALGIPQTHAGDISVWNLRGHALPLDRLVPKLVERMKGQNFCAVVIDPIYKVITGDENSASDMGAFCNQFDRICTETGSAVIYCHHHSKGAQGQKRAMDRASGSGVFARDPDAQLDLIALEMSDDIMNNVRDGRATAWRMESSLREFANIRPLNIWFEYPIHRTDESGELESVGVEGSFEAVRARNKKCTTAGGRQSAIDTAYEVCSLEPPVTVSAMAEYLGISERCARSRLREFGDNYWVKSGLVGKREG